MKSALVGGGTGFLGSAVARRLIRSGYNVFIPTRHYSEKRRQADPGGKGNNITYLDANTDWHQVVADIEFEKIFHLAAANLVPSSFSDIEKIVDANITQGLKLALISSNQTLKPALIYAQSSWQFSEGGQVPVPNGVYSALKHGFQQVAEVYRHKMNVPAIGLVVFDTYGENDKRTKLLPCLAKLIADQKKGLTVNPLPMTDGTQEACFIHVDDAADAFLMAAENASRTDLNSEKSIFFLSEDQPVFLKELINKLLADYDDPTTFVKWGAKQYRSEDVHVLAKGPKLPNWKPRRSIRETFENMVIGFEND